MNADKTNTKLNRQVAKAAKKTKIDNCLFLGDRAVQLSFLSLIGVYRRSSAANP